MRGLAAEGISDVTSTSGQHVQAVARLTFSHRFSILDHDVLKMYEGISNVIMRISAPGRQRGDKDTVLLGSHIDSALPAPGAAE